MIEPLLLDLPSFIDTERLSLRAPQAGDGQSLHPALHESLPNLRRFLASLPWVAAEQTPESAERWCRNAQANFLARKDLPFLIFERETGELVGACGLHRTEWETPKTEVGYWVRSSRAGQGFITEAVGGLCGYAFAHLNAVRVELVVDEENTPSRRVADRCGFQLEGTLRSERRAPDGTLRNTCVYARFPANPQCAAMSETKPPADDAATWQRKTAMRCNNRAWELTVQPRTPAQDRAMLDAAHASAFHWGEIGTDLHRMRATMLLAEVHALLGHGATAMALAEEMRTYFLARTDTPDWELAFTHAIHAHCAHAAGDAVAHRVSYAKAQAALAAITDAEDRDIVQQTFAQVPAP